MTSNLNSLILLKDLMCEPRLPYSSSVAVLPVCLTLPLLWVLPWLTQLLLNSSWVDPLKHPAPATSSSSASSLNDLEEAPNLNGSKWRPPAFRAPPHRRRDALPDCMQAVLCEQKVLESSNPAPPTVHSPGRCCNFHSHLLLCEAGGVGCVFVIPFVIRLGSWVSAPLGRTRTISKRRQKTRFLKKGAFWRKNVMNQRNWPWPILNTCYIQMLRILISCSVIEMQKLIVFRLLFKRGDYVSEHWVFKNAISLT